MFILSVPQILQFYPLAYLKENMSFTSTKWMSQSSGNELDNRRIICSPNYFCPCIEIFRASTLFYSVHIY